MQGNGLKLAAVVAFLVISLWKLFPTVQNALNQRDLAAMDSTQAAQYRADNFERLRDTQEASLNLGLDLQGGMHVTLEVGAGALLTELAGTRADDVFTQAIATANREAESSTENYVTLFARAVEDQRAGTRLARYFRNASSEITARSENGEVETFLRGQVDLALSRAEEIIRQRVDRFGVTEPLIQRQGTGRIVVEMPGVDDPQRVRDLLRGTAKLSFHLTPPTAEVAAFQQRLRAYYAGQTPEPAATDSSATDSTAAARTAAADSGAASLDQITGARTTAAGPASADARFEEVFRFLDPAQLGPNSPLFAQVAAADTAAARRLLEAPGAKALLPLGMRLLLTAKAEGTDTPMYDVVAVNERAELSGEVVTEAGPDFDPFTNAPQVSLTMNGEGASRWRQITSANTGKPVAVVLDDRVYTYPTINGTIPNGRTQITGSFTKRDVDDIVTVLQSGALPAPVNIVGERTIGPSLGAQAVRNGSRSALIGLLLVTLSIAFYYRTAGMLASVALFLNLLFLFGILASFGATLTLPGIAGIVLTIGMAVDANVLIFERIREELDGGKSMKAAVDGGFDKALSAIADGNITTFLIGVVLYSFGTGPIQGFAVTLMAGIATSLFAALVVTRLLVDWTLARTHGRPIAFG
jgi:preprotein translocase subunit SecD